MLKNTQYFQNQKLFSFSINFNGLQDEIFVVKFNKMFVISLNK
jgi:hypothetical protein